MSIWHKEVVRIDGELMAYVGVQDDYYGTIRYGLRNIHLTGALTGVKQTMHM